MKKAHEQAGNGRQVGIFHMDRARKKKINHDIADSIEEYVQEIVSTSLWLFISENA